MICGAAARQERGARQIDLGTPALHRVVDAIALAQVDNAGHTADIEHEGEVAILAACVRYQRCMARQRLAHASEPVFDASLGLHSRLLRTSHRFVQHRAARLDQFIPDRCLLRGGRLLLRELQQQVKATRSFVRKLQCRAFVAATSSVAQRGPAELFRLHSSSYRLGTKPIGKRQARDRGPGPGRRGMIAPQRERLVMQGQCTRALAACTERGGKIVQRPCNVELLTNRVRAALRKCFLIMRDRLIVSTGREGDVSKVVLTPSRQAMFGAQSPRANLEGPLI